jgi:ribonuclease HII
MGKATLDIFKWEHLLPNPIIGVDEVGRGCLAGRVYAAAVILQSDAGIREYTDSKALSAVRRLELSNHIKLHHKVGIGFATVDEVDRINIFQASFLAMRRAIEALNVEHGHILVDGKYPIPEMKRFKQTTIIKGDLRASPISAASIVAKVTRDQYMEELAVKYDSYGFEKHKGYSTQEHMEKIAKYGPCKEHRKTFRGVKEYIVPAAGLNF